jgi:molecular chaperone GrpE
MSTTELNNELTENQQTEKIEATAPALENAEAVVPEDEMKKTTKETETLRKELNEKEVALLAMEQERNDWKEKFMRKMAEFDNYKRRTDQEMQSVLKYAGEKLVTKLLPVIDDFERSIQHITESSDVKTLQQGVQLIYEKFLKFLSDQEISKIEAVGKPFDVHFHDALYQQPSEQYAPNTVIQEIQSGYLYKDRVLRHSQVIVAAEQENAPKGETARKEDSK